MNGMYTIEIWGGSGGCLIFDVLPLFWDRLWNIMGVRMERVLIRNSLISYELLIIMYLLEVRPLHSSVSFSHWFKYYSLVSGTKGHDVKTVYTRFGLPLRSPFPDPDSGLFSKRPELFVPSNGAIRSRPRTPWRRRI